MCGIRGIAFDIDQTLWDFHSARRAALDGVLTALLSRTTVDGPEDRHIDDLQARYDRLEAARPASALSAIRRESLHQAAAVAAPGDKTLGDELGDLYFSIRHQPGNAFDDARPALEELSALGLKLAVVSNGNTSLEALQLSDLFATVVLAPDVGTAKPEPQIYSIVEHQLSLAPAALVCVGDDLENDVCAPQRKGWRGIWNRRDPNQTADGCTPDATVALLTELPAIIEQWL
ncbi:MAG: HAD family hydrolase [Actinobacteria bacterium]|nr:HAD family hydrolase [Actinomycetota bacterium]